MSAKAQFLQKLKKRQSGGGSFASKSQADIATFCQRMSQLQEDMEEWLTGTGVHVEKTSVSLIDLLVDNSTFSVPGVVLRYESSAVNFTPLFLYGQGVTGCVEASLCTKESIVPLYRLFMRSGKSENWTCRPSGEAVPVSIFCEELFFEMIAGLLS